jgi:SAM-dependent methyltransferase
MRRASLELLRCPRCLKGSLLPDPGGTDVAFGPVRCAGCQASFPVSEGVVELTDAERPGPLLQRGLNRALVARSYERYVRPALQAALFRRHLDVDSEYLLYHSLLGAPEGPILDLGCGTGLFARRLAREAALGSILALDASTPMLDEAVAQSRESGVRIDFIHAAVPPLPFQDHSLGAILQSGSLHLIRQLPELLLEVSRTLRPGGRYVASTYCPPGFPARSLHRGAGLFPRDEGTLRSAVAAAGLVAFERVLLSPWLVLKAERPRLG